MSPSCYKVYKGFLERYTIKCCFNTKSILKMRGKNFMFLTNVSEGTADKNFDR